MEEGRSRRRRRRRRRCFYSSAGWDPPLSLACCQCRWQALPPSPASAALVAVRHWLTDGLGGASARCAACGRRRAVCGMQRAVCMGCERVCGVWGMCAYLWVTIFLILCNIACGTRCTSRAHLAARGSLANEKRKQMCEMSFLLGKHCVCVMQAFQMIYRYYKKANQAINVQLILREISILVRCPTKLEKQHDIFN